MMHGLEVIRPGPMTTVQDLGRFGFQRFGVPVSGAVDRFSHRVVNLLVGNTERAATLELTFVGAKFKALAPLKIALGGAEMSLKINGRPAPNWAGLEVEPGDVIRIGTAKSGVRGYLAVSGGIDTEPVMGSRSTYLGGAIGGLEGRALKAGDLIPVGRRQGSGGGRLPDDLRPVLKRDVELAVIPGPQEAFFKANAEVFHDSAYQVSTATDRMGCRLDGPPVHVSEGMPFSIISEPSIAGAVQVPAQGLPIILLNEQTVGGYAKVATVISADLDRVAQLRPGGTVRFRVVDIDEARGRYFKRQLMLQFIRDLV